MKRLFLAATVVSPSLQIDASSPPAAQQAVTTTPTVTTASFTPPANSLLVAMWESNSISGVDPATPTIGGGGLTWTLRQFKHRGDGVSPTVDAQVAVWTAPVPSSAAMTATVTNGAGADHPSPGAGLGLALAREVARRHGGEVSALSLPDLETRITLRLPIAGNSSGRLLVGAAPVL